MATSIEWDTTDLPMERCERILGAEYVRDIIAGGHAALVFESRANGAWYANDRERYAALRSLVKLVSK